MPAATQSPPRLTLNGVDSDEDRFDAGLDPYSFYSKRSHDSPYPLSASPSAEPDGSRANRVREEMQADSSKSTHVRPTSSSGAIRRSGSGSGSNRPIDPASIPTRTSSSNAVANGEKHVSPKKSPRHHKSLGSVPEESRRRPEVNEKDWIAAARANPTPVRTESQRNSQRSSYGAQASMSPTESKRNSQRSSYGQQPLMSPTSTNVLRHIGSEFSMDDEIAHWTADKENILKGPFEYLEGHPGKDIRTQLISAFNAWLQVPTSSLQIITKVVGMLHTASLLIDDVEDSSLLRRGVPVAHSIFGTAQTINSANYVYFCALQELLTLNNPEAIRIYTDELLNLHRGQGMDLFWRDTLTCPSEDDYLEMVGNKTGGLFRLAIKLMCAESPSQAQQQADYVPLVDTIGLLFQILDDYRNLSDTAYTANKGLCEDLTEGKFSFPIIHSIRSDPSNLVLVNILKQKTKDDEVKRYAVQYMDKTGSFTYTRRVLRGLTKKALALVDEVDAGRGLGDGVRTIMEKLRVEKHSKGDSVT